MGQTLETIRPLVKEVRQRLMDMPNVEAVGIGYKTVQGKKTDQLSIVCSVTVKKPKARLTQRDRIPTSIQDIPTDVYPTGPIYAFQDPTGRFRPAPGGVSIGHYLITAGTLGCYVKKDNQLYVLSNNHVLANSNNAEIGDPIYQPGPYDGGTSEDKFAELSEFVPIQFEGDDSGGICPFAVASATILNWLARLVGSRTRLQPVRSQAAQNRVDCALARPLNDSDVLNEILNIGKIQGVTEGTLGMSVKKSGRTTGLTTGTITQIDVSSWVSYGSSRRALFVDQLMAGAMSQGGDSGSAVLDDQNNLVGLLFAGSTNTTLFNRIQNVFSALQVSLP